jgi:chemotaxis signal transduction protein
MTKGLTSPAGSTVGTLAARLARFAARATEGASTNDAAANQAVLSARARVLAKPRAVHDDAATADRMEVLVFLIGDERLAVPLHSIVAIIRAAIVTPLPRAVAPVYGVTAWRGRPLTVLSIGATAVDALRRLVVLGDGRRAVAGLLVDSAEDTLIVARSKLSPAQAGARAAIATGVTDDGILVLDADAVLNAARPEP